MFLLTISNAKDCTRQAIVFRLPHVSKYFQIIKHNTVVNLFYFIYMIRDAFVYGNTDVCKILITYGQRMHITSMNNVLYHFTVKYLILPDVSNAVSSCLDQK